MQRYPRLRALAFAVMLAASPIGAGNAVAQAASEPPSSTTGNNAPITGEQQLWNLHGQSTVVWQGHGRFRARYEGENSLNSGGEGKESVSVTPSLGVRLWPGTSFYFNPEVFQGFGLAGTHGVAGFVNGEAQKGGSLEPKVYVARAFFRHTIGLGGETEAVADAFNQLGGSRDVSRLTLTWGRFAVKDVFDANTYASDARVDFLNFSIWAGGALDFAADQKGYGIGAVSELNQKDWAWRIGFFRQPIHSNAQSLSWDIGRQGQFINEIELRYKLLEQPGILRLLGWGARSNAGSYREALADTAFDPESSIVATRRIRTQYGYGLNLEQAVTKNIGAFARYSWRDAKSDVMSWTDIDASVSGGIAIAGAMWGRPRDELGAGFAVNRLAKDYRNYIAAGGLGLVIGDGRLGYSAERVFETYYAIGLDRHFTLSFDYQYAVNPAYNADRGPVSLYAMRLRGVF